MVSIATKELKYERGHFPPPGYATGPYEVWAVGTYEYFQAFIPVVLEKICLTGFKMFSCVRSQIICISKIRASF